jgi:hypothetical protein
MLSIIVQMLDVAYLIIVDKFNIVLKPYILNNEEVSMGLNSIIRTVFDRQNAGVDRFFPPKT